MKKIFVVRGTTGEYSDRMEWISKAFNKEDDAKKFILFAEEKAREILTKAKKDDYTYWYSEVAEKFFPEFLKLDPHFQMDYNGTHYFYDECTLE